MSRSRMPYLIGALGAAAGFYFYRAGGDPELAKQKIKNDAHRASVDVKSHLPGHHTDPNAQDKLANYGARAGAEVDKVKAEVAKQAEQSRNDIVKGIDKFDEKVGEGSSKAKSSVSGWFGGSK
jgi:hypothetical protein